MPCGCKKGAGMTVHGGGFKRKKRRRKKGGGWASSMGEALFNPAAFAMRGLVGGYSRLGGRMPGNKFAGVFQRSKTALGRKRGSGQHFLSGVTWQGYGKNKKTGSGMGFSGSGMSWTGSGLMGKRMMFRQGSGRRTV